METTEKREKKNSAKWIRERKIIPRERSRVLGPHPFHAIDPDLRF